MIYFVDEDVNETEPYAYHLQTLGYETRVLENADDAFECLIVASDIEAIVLDVMLATRESNKNRFEAFTTNNFITTGLKLLDDLVQQQGEGGADKLLKKIILFSAATRPEIVGLIRAKSEHYGITYLNKLEYDDVENFADVVLNIARRKQL